MVLFFDCYIFENQVQKMFAHYFSALSIKLNIAQLFPVLDKRLQAPSYTQYLKPDHFQNWN